MHELYERVNEVLRLPDDAVPLRAAMGVERELALAEDGSTLEPHEIADVASALEGLYELREWFCGNKAEAKVGRSPGGGRGRRVGRGLGEGRRGGEGKGGGEVTMRSCFCESLVARPSPSINRPRAHGGVRWCEGRGGGGCLLYCT